jgi:uncharacterized protein (DUF433 family)
VNEKELLQRITVNPKIFGGKPIIRGRRLAVEHVLGMLVAGDTAETILEGYPWLELEDIQAEINSLPEQQPGPMQGFALVDS